MSLPCPRVRSFWSRSLRSGTLRSRSFGSEAKFDRDRNVPDPNDRDQYDLDPLAPPLAGPCPAPFISVAGGCYQFLDSTPVTWDVARSSCQDNGGDLAVIDDCSVMADIIGFIEGAGQPYLKKNELMK